MAVNWYTDEGLDRLIDEWKTEYPKAVVYRVGDASHLSRDSEHNPEPAGSKPGQSKGEVDAADFMPSGGPTMADLRKFSQDLVDSRDPRLLYVIIDDRICSSVVSPWKWRNYSGNRHSHLHVSVNDNYKNNTADWKWEDEKVTLKMVKLGDDAELPDLSIGMEDPASGTKHIKRLQAVLDWLTPYQIDIDGVYGKHTAMAVEYVMRNYSARSSSNGSKISTPEWRAIFAIQ